MRRACQLAALAAAALTFASSHAGAQSVCAPAVPASATAASYEDAIMDRRVSLHGRDISLRDALDRLSAAASVRLSYSSEVLELTRPVCLEYESVPVGRVLENLLAGLDVRPVVMGSNLIVLTPASRTADKSTGAPLVTSIGMLDHVVVTGSTIGASQRTLPIAIDVVSGRQLSERGASSLSGALSGVVPGLWLWEQSPLSLLARYGSIRGASSFGVSYPKVYVDGIEVANSLLVTRLDPESISRIEVIRGPQGAALYGADAISGVLNIVTRQEGPHGGEPYAQIRTQGGASSSEYSTGNVIAQSHALSLNAGSNVRSARLGMTLNTIGSFIPGASSRQVTANGGLRFVRSRGVITGTLRVFAQDARTPSSPLLAGIDAWAATAAAARLAGIDYLDRTAAPPGSPMDSTRLRRLDSLSRLVVMDSSDHQTVRQFTLGANATLAQNDRWTHSFVTGLDGYRLRSASVLDGAFPSALDSALRAATGNAIRTTLRASSVGKFGDPATKAATVTLAAEHTYVRDETETQDLFAPSLPSGAPPRDDDRRRLTETRNNAGVIGQLTASLQETFFVSGGLRIERNSNLNGVGDIATLPMLGASFVRSTEVGTIKLRTAYGKGIRPPRTSSRAGTLLGLTGTVSPEEQSGIELGADLFVKSASFHVTRFNQQATGLIQPVSVFSVADNDGGMAHYRRVVYELQNVGEISNRGWELQGSLGTGPWRLGATFSQVDSRVRKLASRYTGDLLPGDRMLEVPARTFGVTAGFNQGRWSMSSSLSRASDWINYDRLALLNAFTNQNNNIREFVGPELRSYWRTYNGVTRLGGRVDVSLGKGASFILNGENLLDNQFGQPDNITVLPGRTISAGLRVGF